MAKKKSSAKPNGTLPKLSKTFSNLHNRVSAQLAKENIQPSWKFSYSGTDDPSIRKRYTTHIMGRFTCNNKTCPNPGWGSKKISIVIQELPGNRYNAVVFKQRCKRCDTLGVMAIDEECYVERVSYRLKKWSGIKMEEHEHFEQKRGLPHKTDFCEGVMARTCESVYGGKEWLEAVVQKKKTTI
ncbi:hypothetical protein VTJ83DRAFT_7521 [Remersonia thermophila]|uniref:3CxxC-type domain-containing protein n=1 Tax=Remersonia thermophila TaxID=72144 RepID=A0ABR4D588_9PEZI